MREIVLQINFWEANIDDQKKYIEELIRCYEELDDEPLLNYINCEKSELLNLKMNYLGMVRAWLDTLPEELLLAKYDKLQDCIKEKFLEYYKSKDEQVLFAYSYGYYRVLNKLERDYNVEDKLYTHNRILGRIKVNLLREKILHDNIFKRVQLNNSSFYDLLSKRQGISSEIKQIRLSRINKNY